jgi:hypothetical protein
MTNVKKRNKNAGLNGKRKRRKKTPAAQLPAVPQSSILYYKSILPTIDFIISAKYAGAGKRWPKASEKYVFPLKWISRVGFLPSSSLPLSNFAPH